MTLQSPHCSKWHLRWKMEQTVSSLSINHNSGFKWRVGTCWGHKIRNYHSRLQEFRDNDTSFFFPGWTAWTELTKAIVRKQHFMERTRPECVSEKYIKKSLGNFAFFPILLILMKSALRNIANIEISMVSSQLL